MFVKRIFNAAAAQSFLAWTAARYVTLVARTTRWRIEGEPHLQAFAAGGPCIVVFWHENLPAMPVFWLTAKRLGLQREAVVLASRHRDGQLIGLAVQNLGIGLVSGSSSRGGAAGLRGLLSALGQGHHVGLTPDGPRGPRRVAEPGVAQLAALGRVPVLPCGVHTRWAIQLKSWDAMRLPLPFGRGALVCGAFVEVAREDWAAALPGIEAALNNVTRRAGQLA
jgi:lysophospholipid acyltransferase (LPLAT)-like uncharacterized protein